MGIGENLEEGSPEEDSLLKHDMDAPRMRIQRAH